MLRSEEVAFIIYLSPTVVLGVTAQTFKTIAAPFIMTGPIAARTGRISAKTGATEQVAQTLGRTAGTSEKIGVMSGETSEICDKTNAIYCKISDRCF